MAGCVFPPLINENVLQISDEDLDSRVLVINFLLITKGSSKKMACTQTEEENGIATVRKRKPSGNHMPKFPSELEILYKDNFLPSLFFSFFVNSSFFLFSFTTIQLINY